MRAAPTSLLDRAFAVQCIQHTLEQQEVIFTLQEATRRFAPTAQALIFGGVLRNSVLSAILHKPFPVRDLDFVVFGLASDDELHRAFATERARRNSFGGVKFIMDGVTIDMWRAELELQIAGQQPHVASIEDFLKCVTLTTDAALYDPRTTTLHEQEFLRAMVQKTINLGADSRWVDPWVPYHLAHLAYVREVTGFSISDQARARVHEVASESVVEQAVQYLESRAKCTDPREAVLSLVNKA